MEAVLAKANDLEMPVDKFDTAIADLTGDDPLYEAEVYEQEAAGDAVSVQPQAVAERLSRVLTLALPQYEDSTRALVCMPFFIHILPDWENGAAATEPATFLAHFYLLEMPSLSLRPANTFILLLTGTRAWKAVPYHSVLAARHSRHSLLNHRITHLSQPQSRSNRMGGKPRRDDYRFLAQLGYRAESQSHKDDKA